MTTFLLIRHGAHRLGGDVIAGRSPGARLSELGIEQAGIVAERLSELPLSAVYSSPVERAWETAGVVSERLALPVSPLEWLAEVHFGDWSGRKIEELRKQDSFGNWNTFRSGTRIPGGEAMVETQARVVTGMLELREAHRGQFVALVSHGDVIKAAMAYFLGIPLDLFHRMEIGLASISIVAIGERGPWIWCVNHTGGGMPVPQELLESCRKG